MAQISPKWPPQGFLRTLNLWTVPLFIIWVNLGNFGPEKGVETIKENWT